MVALPRLKSQLQRSLGDLGLYQRVRGSRLYDFYWTVADKRIIDDRRSEVRFYRDLLKGLRPGDLIFDVGANQGYKADIFLRLGAKVVAVEPDEFSQEILKQKFLRYRLRKRPLIIVGKAVSDRTSIETLWIDTPGSAKNTLSQKWVGTLRDDEKRFGHRLGFERRREIQTVTLQQLIEAYGLPFFVKIDVEGYELSVLQGMQRPVPFLSFEVNLPEFRPEGLDCIGVLARLTSGEFNYTSDCRRGLALERWLPAEEFSAVLDSCNDASVEVFWRTYPQ